MSGPKQTPGRARHKGNPSTFCAKEFKIVALRDCPLESPLCDNPKTAFKYWRTHIETHPYFMPQVESFFVILLNTRQKVIGHHLVSLGTQDTILTHPRETFRAAVIGSASAIIMMHNHPSGDPSPSEADIKTTQDFIQCGELLQIELVDHIIVGKMSAAKKPDEGKALSASAIRKGCGYASLRELGYFAPEPHCLIAHMENLSISEAIIETIRAWKDGSLVEGFIHMELNRYFGTAVHQDDFNHALKRLRADKKLRRIGRSSRIARWALPKTGSAR